MPNKPKTQSQLLAENADLRARLDQAEATLSEILSGKADALFVTGVAGAQLFTLRGADQSYRTLIENMSEGALTLTPEGLVLYANRRFAGMVKAPLEKVIGSEIHNWFTPKSRQALQALLQRDALDNHHEELALAAAGGTQVPVYLSVSRLHLDGIPDSICMVATDLTERKRNEAILAAEKLSNAILEQAADAIVICDESGRIIRASRQAQALYGNNPVGQLFEQTFPLRQPDGTAFSAVSVIDTKRSLSAEARLEPNGQGFDLLVSVGHLKGSRDELLGSVVTLTDITERKQAEAKLRESELAYRTLSQNLPGMVYRVFVREGERMQFYNAMPVLITGYAADELTTGTVCSIEPLILDEDRPGVMAEVGSAIAGKRAFAVEYRLKHKDGGIRWMAEHGMPVYGADGAPLYIDGVIFDITEHKQAEIELKLFRALIDNSNDAIEVLEPETYHFLDVNEAGCRMLGYSREEFLFMSVFDIDPSFDDAAAAAFGKELRKTGSARFEGVHRRTDGSTFPVDVSTRFIELDRPYLLSIVRDITERKQAEVLLHESEERLRAIFDGTLDGIALADVETRQFATVNSAMCHMFGYSTDEFVRLSIPDIHRQQDWPYVFEQFEKQARGEIQLATDMPVMRKDGSVFYADINTSSLGLGGKHYILGVVRDITERKNAEARIKYLNRVLSVLSGINTLIVRVKDREELFREACNIAIEEGGFRMAMLAIVDRSTKQITSFDSAGMDDELLSATKSILSTSEGVQSTMIARTIREKKAVVSNDVTNDPRVLFGKKYAESGVRSLVVLPLIVAGEAVGVLALYANEINFFLEEELKLLSELAGDIGYAIDHIEKQERLNYLAYYDVLTGLANRTLFLDRLAHYMRSAANGGNRLAIGLIDLERFKNINDSLGRTAGDALLTQVAAWFTYKTGDANLLARIDADHFALVMPEIKQVGELARLVENFMTAFQEHPFKLNDAVFRIRIKVGIALFPDDGADADILFRNAEVALKKAKASGDRFLFYTQQMTAAVAGNLTLENQLRQAIDNEEFVLYYQPKVNLVSGKVTSAEALIRWNDPRTGLVPPGRFIPILEETGLIHEVGRWALRKAISDHLRWRTMGLPAVRIAVNVSAMQLHSPGFITEIEQAVAIDAHVAAGLELEITESLVMEDIQYSIDTLKVIRAMGITFAIDDFGTGFSSLSYLAKLPVDTLKIDRSFVIEMDAPEGLALVSTIIVVAHALKLKVVAEGVETDMQMRQLLSLDCDEMQGFLFSKPVPAEIFEAKFLVPLSPNESR